MPVIVTVLVPSGAEPLAINVSVAYPLVGLGVNDAVTPFGSPDIPKFTSPANPYSGITKTEAVDVVPRPMTIGLLVDSTKVGAKTFSLKVVVAVILPDVPVTVIVLDPSAVLLLAVSVNLEEYVVGFWSKDAVTPVGNPATENATLPENPNSSKTQM